MNFQTLFRSPFYQRLLQQARLHYERLQQEGHDVIIPPEETPLPISPMVAALASQQEGNWANGWLMENLQERVTESAEGKALIIVIDDGNQILNEYLPAYAFLQEHAANFTDAPDGPGGHSHLVVGNMVGDHPTLPLGIIRQLAAEGLVKIVVVKGLHNGTGSYNDLTRAAEYANELALKLGYDTNIVTNSWGGTAFWQPLAEVIRQGTAEGIIWSASAGNSGGSGDPSTVKFPAKMEEVFAWAALDPDGSRAGYSSAGPEVFGTAPGSQVLSTTASPNGLALWNGTSGSAPHAAGIMACIGVMYPDINTESEMQAVLKEWITDLPPAGFDNFHGHGVPKLAPYLDREPGEDPDPPTPPTREKRFFRFFLSEPGDIVWRRIEEQELKRLTITRLEIEVKTSNFSAPAFDIVQWAVVAFLTNRGLIIPNNMDYQDAAQWTGRFIHMIAGKEIDFTITELQAHDEKGRSVIIEEKAMAITRRIEERPAAQVFDYIETIT